MMIWKRRQTCPQTCPQPWRRPASHLVDDGALSEVVVGLNVGDGPDVLERPLPVCDQGLVVDAET